MTPEQSQERIKRRAKQRSKGQPYKPFVSEKQLSELVRKAAILTGFMPYHTWMSIRSQAGFPDYIMVHPKKGRLIVVELKTETGKLQEKQEEWLEAFGKVPGVEVHLLRPSGFDAFFEVLKR